MHRVLTSMLEGGRLTIWCIVPWLKSLLEKWLERKAREQREFVAIMRVEGCNCQSDSVWDEQTRLLLYLAREWIMPVGKASDLLYPLAEGLTIALHLQLANLECNKAISDAIRYSKVGDGCCRRRYAR